MKHRITGGPLAGTEGRQVGREDAFLVLDVGDDGGTVRVHERLCEALPEPPKLTPEHVLNECLRQGRLKAEGRFQYTPADPEMTHPERLAVLVEEVGEVARAILEGADRSNLRTELIQAAAVCVSWVVAIDRGDA